jgi:hypothetical protein
MFDKFNLRIFNLLGEPLHCAHGNKCIRTHDAIHNIFVVIAQGNNFHVEWEQLYALLSNTFNFFCWQVDIMFTKDDIRTLVDKLTLCLPKMTFAP